MSPVTYFVKSGVVVESTNYLFMYVFIYVFIYLYIYPVLYRVTINLESRPL